jgi:hypothetical protein
MLDTVIIGQFERRLLELGCPATQARHKARELADHHADLKQAALEEGFSETEAEARAAAQLGEPAGLAEKLACAMRQSSWWGRHPVIGFCLLPLFGLVPFWVLCGSLLAGVVWLVGHLLGPAYLVNMDTANALALDPKEFANYSQLVNALLNSAAVAVMSIQFCHLARRSASGLKWILAACAVCSFSGAFTGVYVGPHCISAGICPPDRICAAIPWIVAAAAFLRQHLIVRRLPAPVMPSGSSGGRNGNLLEGLHPFDGGRPWVHNFLKTPTYWIAAPALAGILAMGGFACHEIMRQRTERLEGPARTAALRARAWPAESAAVMERVKSRQMAAGTDNVTLIDLRGYVNVRLTPGASVPHEPGENALAELPQGVHTFGGAPFEVSGKIQLMGRALLKANRIYPVTRKNIPIAQKCSRILMLHGASHAAVPGDTIAKLVLHYSDGSTGEIPIVSGEHLLDCWGPIYTTPAMGERLVPCSPDTELAWVGNSAGDPQTPSLVAARIYKSAFANPKPDLEISSIDYISTLTGAAPFLFGLTLEKATEQTQKLENNTL